MSDSDEEFNDDLLEPQIILDADEYQNTMSDDEDNQSSSSLLEVQIDDRSAFFHFSVKRDVSKTAIIWLRHWFWII